MLKAKNYVHTARKANLRMGTVAPPIRQYFKKRSFLDRDEHDVIFIKKKPPQNSPMKFPDR